MMDFESTKNLVRQVALRLDSPASDYNYVFTESDEAVEVRVESGNSLEPLFVFIVDAERFRVIKDLEINPDGYATFTYHSYIELLSFIIEYFYPVFFKLNNGASITDMVSRILKENVRIWKDILRVVCKAGNVEYYDFGNSFSVMSVNFSYNSEMRTLSLSGELSETYKCRTVMELTVTLLTILAYLFQREELEINPIIGDQLQEEDSEMEDMEDTMELGDEIDGSMGDDGGGEPQGEDLAQEFEPSGDSVESTTPDIQSGKQDLMNDVGA